MKQKIEKFDRKFTIRENDELKLLNNNECESIDINSNRVIESMANFSQIEIEETKIRTKTLRVEQQLNGITVASSTLRSVLLMKH